MALNIFLFFPENEVQILNDDTKRIIHDFFGISKKIKGQKDIRLFYDAQNVINFIELNKLTEIYLDSDTNQLRIKLNKLSAIDITNQRNIDDSCCYFQWNLNYCKVEYCFEILKEILEQKVRFSSDQYILINFNNSIEHCRERILIFKDAKHINNLPVNFVHIDFVSDFLEFEIWLKTNHVLEFSLLDKNKFRRTSLVQQGKPVFVSLNTGYFWYLDNFHKDEYEVFDTNKNHIGVSDLKGNLDLQKAITGRTFGA
jgi:hypothetical protein